jgi:hypothetical protein
LIELAALLEGLGGGFWLAAAKPHFFVASLSSNRSTKAASSQKHFWRSYMLLIHNIQMALQ